MISKDCCLHLFIKLQTQLWKWFLWCHFIKVLFQIGAEHKHDKYFSLWRHTLLEGHWNNMKLELFVYEIRFIHYFGEELWNVNLTFHGTITAPAWTHLEVWYSIQRRAVNFIDQILELGSIGIQECFWIALLLHHFAYLWEGEEVHNLSWSISVKSSFIRILFYSFSVSPFLPFSVCVGI